MPMMLSANFIQNQLFQNIPGIQSECQTIWIQIKSDIMSVLTRVQTVCKDYQQMTKVTACKERVMLMFSLSVPMRFLP